MVNILGISDSTDPEYSYMYGIKNEILQFRYVSFIFFYFFLGGGAIMLYNFIIISLFLNIVIFMFQLLF